MVYRVVEDPPKAFEIRVSECLWAKMVPGGERRDMGYAGICHPDYAAVSGFDPKIKLISLENAYTRP
jgi:hypothetical protein